MVVCGGGINYVSTAKNGCEAVLKLLSVCYVLHLEYPAMYGLMHVIGKVVLEDDEESVCNIPKNSKENQNLIISIIHALNHLLGKKIKLM